MGKWKVTYYLFEANGDSLGYYAREIERRFPYSTRLVDPDEHGLYMNCRTLLESSGTVHIVEVKDDLSRWIYLGTKKGELTGEKVAYEYIIGKEEGLKAVLKEIAGGKAHRYSSGDWLSFLFQMAIWSTFLVLGYLGYKNDELDMLSGMLPLFLLVSGAVEGIRRGYKKKKKR